MKHNLFIFFIFVFCILFVSCGSKELTPEEAEIQRIRAYADFINNKTVKKYGGGEYPPGVVGGTWVSSMTNDPKTFNTLWARDGDSRDVVDRIYDYLVDYDPYTREWKPNLADWEIIPDKEHDTMDVIFTLRNDIYWTTPAEPDKKIKVTSDDVVFWYNEIEGDKNLQQPGYPGKLMKMPDGTEKRITMEKLDDLRFVVHYPRIIADPLLNANMTFGPRYVFEKVKKEQGIEGLQDLYTINTDVKTIPSVGKFYITGYSPGVRVVLERNPHYWRKDDKGTGYPYIEKLIFKIVPDTNTEFLLFKEGQNDDFTVRPEDLDELVNKENPDYTVYNGGETLGSLFITFNQNPAHIDEKVYNWFKEKKFRQAMSCILNRERIARQVFRGMAVPALHFFAKANMFFDEKIKLPYTYDPDRAVRLLGEIGITKNSEGEMVDSGGNRVEFTMNMSAEYNVGIDLANIFVDECKNIGIEVKIRPIDFQKIVDMTMNTFEWECILIGLGSNYWPTGGSNVWQSSGNFHLWHPLQESPATEWEARVDKLYNEGRFELDKEKRKKIYDEYQELILEQVPVLYTVHSLNFLAVRNKWENIFYDTLNGLDIMYVYPKKE
ncbi:MAG: ABC transporter substrate-binding protein [Spirochaetales bacterium]|nr:ABC transporter substrate-binding protein [Spirochaetales bacterium]